MGDLYDGKKMYAKNFVLPLSKTKGPALLRSLYSAISSSSWARTKDPLINSQML